ncbi:MAG TPA: family 16 glycoside hydrolase [Thermomicrobiales bacterium]|nr:family 16 glycoside hydrolase [Thermomicrobiales bacterium]
MLYTWFAPAEYVFGDFRLEVDARKVAGPASLAYGVVFRAQPRAAGPPKAFYLFTITDEQVVTLNLTHEQGPATVLAGRPRSAAIAQGGLTNHLTVTCAGNRITPSVNGQMVGTYSGALVTPGLIGLQIGAPPGIAAPDGLTAAFSNLVVSRVG